MNWIVKLAVCGVISWCSVGHGLVVAQKPGEGDGPVGIFSSRQEYYQFMGQAKQAAYGEGGSPELQAMIPMLNDIVLNRPTGSTSSQYKANGSTLDLLSDERVRKEIDMLDDQHEELKALSQRTWQEAANKIRSLDFSNRDGLVDQIRKIRAEADEQVNTVLLPHQLERLRQLYLRSKLRNRSLVDLLTMDPIKTKLEISDAQADELKKYEQVVQDELEKEIAKLREAARLRLVNKLRPTQAKKAKELLGEAFRFPQPQPASRKRVKDKGGKAKGLQKETGKFSEGKALK